MLHDEFSPKLDKINPISPKNRKRSTYMNAAEQFLKGGGVS